MLGKGGDCVAGGNILVLTIMMVGVVFVVVVVLGVTCLRGVGDVLV